MYGASDYGSSQLRKEVGGGGGHDDDGFVCRVCSLDTMQVDGTHHSSPQGGAPFMSINQHYSSFQSFVTARFPA